MNSSMIQGTLVRCAPSADTSRGNEPMTLCWLLAFPLTKSTMLYFSEIEGSIHLTVDAEAAQQFDTKDDAETYLGLLHQEHPTAMGLLKKFQVVPHGYA